MTTDHDSTRLPSVTVALVVLLCVAAAAPAAAAGSTALVASPSTPAVQVGGTTTVTLALADADGGVGSAALRVETTEPSVATVADVSVPGAPTTANVTVDADGGGADVRYEGANTPSDEGEVTVATVTLAGEAPGEAGVEVVATATGEGPSVADETGEAYSLSDLETATATVRVVAENLPPRADAGPNRTVESSGPNEPDVRRLDGRNSTDPDGDDGALSYAWEQVSGPSVTLGNAGTARPLYDVPRVETEQVLRFRLTVTDDDGASDADEVAVTVTPPPAPADVAVSNVTATDAPPNASATVTAEVRNVGGRTDADTATVRVDRDGDGVLETDDDEFAGTAFVSVASGETATVSFEVDTTGLAPGTYRVGVFAFGENATGTLVVVDPDAGSEPDPDPATPPVADGFASPTNVDGDAALEDVNGNGELTLADVTALFEYRDSAAVTENPGSFDYNGNGAFTLADVTALFREAR